MTKMIATMNPKMTGKVKKSEMASRATKGRAFGNATIVNGLELRRRNGWSEGNRVWREEVARGRFPIAIEGEELGGLGSKRV